ncbi:MAG: IS630 family transposase, partial [Alphaproteobacteria bacterium]
HPTPFRWTKSADDILAAINRFCLRTLAVHSQDWRRTSESGH